MTPTAHFLHPGDVTVGFATDSFETLLGSCVSILLVSPCFNVAAMCHFVYASRPSKARSKDASYGVVAMSKMEHLLRMAGFNAKLCNAYVFGGGNMFPGNTNLVDVGSTNVAWAFNYLNSHHIPVFGAQTGENCYRKFAWTVGSQDPCQFVKTVAVLPS